MQFSQVVASNQGLAVACWQISTTRGDAAVAFVSALQMEDGPFVHTLVGPRSQANTLFSHGIVDMLDILNRLGEIDEASLASYVTQCQMTSGGFAANIREASSIYFQPTVLLTKTAIKILIVLSACTTPVREAATSFVLDCYRTDGGFDDAPTQPSSSMKMTHDAIQTLYLLGELDQIDIPKTTTYILSHQNVDNGFGMSPGASSSYLGTRYSVLALYYIGALPLISQSDVIDYLMLGYDDDSGTFQPPGLIDQKGYLEPLSVLGGISRINSTKMEEFVLSCQSHIHGGFVINPDYADDSYSQHGDECSYAVKILNLIGSLDLLDDRFEIQSTPIWTGEDDLLNTGTLPIPIPLETILLIVVVAALGVTFSVVFLLSYRRRDCG